MYVYCIQKIKIYRLFKLIKKRRFSVIAVLPTEVRLSKTKGKHGVIRSVRGFSKKKLPTKRLDFLVRFLSRKNERKKKLLSLMRFFGEAKK